MRSDRHHSREDSGLVLDRDLVWWHDGQRIEHPRITELFNRSLSPSGDGRFVLTIGSDYCYVAVEDAAYEVRAITASEAAIEVTLSDGTVERLDVDSLRVDSSGLLRCHVKTGKAKARFGRQAQVELGLLIEERPEGYWLTSPPPGRALQL